jgi:hypothetical protein
MPENVTFYSQTYDALPEQEMRRLAGTGNWLSRLFSRRPKFTMGQNDEGGRTFKFRWPDLTVTCNEMPAQLIPGHLDGFRSYVRSIYGGEEFDPRSTQIADRIAYTRLVVGVVVEPGRDREGRTKRLLGAMANGLKALMFLGNALYDHMAKLILAPDRSFDPEADVLGPVAEIIKDRIRVKLPEGEPFQPTPFQAARAARVLEQLRQRKVPTLDRFLHIEDEESAVLRQPAEVARRVLVLSAVAFLADGGPRDQALHMIERAGLWPDVSPIEREFLQATTPDPEKAHKLLWRLEGLWVLAWALGDLGLNWPAGMCDVPRLSKKTTAYETDPDFVSKAKLRPTGEILDARQLTMLIHWAIRDAFIHARSIPSDLDWSGDAEMVPPTQPAVVGVVEERHHALNWLTCVREPSADSTDGAAGWDDVDTST